jgi:MFS family permease
MIHQDTHRNFTEALKIPDIRLFIGSLGFFTLSSRALAVVIGFQIYHITHSPLALGWLGLVEAIPAISLAPFGGYITDHFSRRKILLIARMFSCLCTLALALISLQSHINSLISLLYFSIFLAGIARGFADPANTAFEAQVVPKHLTVNASSWIGSSWIACSILGPAVIGFVFDAWGAAVSYLIITGSFILSWICTAHISSKPQCISRQKEHIFKRIGIGWRFVFTNQPLLASLALDLFAVFFGGAMILLPIYANDILHVGVKGLGLLNAAPSFGATIITLIATRYPPIARAGRNLLFSVFGFGISIIVFAVSKNFWLSMAALVFSGVFDGISMLIRRAILRLLSPDELRGRIAAASFIFICASNELGAFESGMLAGWIGTIPCVLTGGIITLGIVALIGRLAPELRDLKFDVTTLERKSKFF